MEVIYGAKKVKQINDYTYWWTSLTSKMKYKKWREWYDGEW